MSCNKRCPAFQREKVNCRRATGHAADDCQAIITTSAHIVTVSWRARGHHVSPVSKAVSDRQPLKLASPRGQDVGANRKARPTSQPLLQSRSIGGHEHSLGWDDGDVACADCGQWACRKCWVVNSPSRITCWACPHCRPIKLARGPRVRS